MDSSCVLSKSARILVHGAWHGGWCWNKLIPHLESSGHRALAVTLTGQGDRAPLINSSIDLASHIADVVSMLEMEDLTDVILVGHSYGGLVICGTNAPGRGFDALFTSTRWCPDTDNRGST